MSKQDLSFRGISYIWQPQVDACIHMIIYIIFMNYRGMKCIYVKGMLNRPVMGMDYARWKYINVMPADVLALCIGRSSADTVMAIYHWHSVNWWWQLRLLTVIGHVTLVAITMTTVLSWQSLNQVTAIHLKIGYLQIESSIKFQWSDKNERVTR